MKGDFEIVVCEPPQREEALRLLTRLWATDLEVNRRYWEWKYDRNPAAGPQRVYLALERGRVVGMRGFIGARWEFGDPETTLWMPCAGDTVVARECESRGVFRAIMDVAQADLHAEGHPFMVNLSAGPTVFLRSLRGGWRAVAGTYEIWQRQGTRDGAALAGTDPLAGMDAAEVGASAGGGIAASDRPRAEQMAALVRRVPWSGGIRRVRDGAYFAWRFDNPLARYCVLYRSSADLDGYLVVRTARYRTTDTLLIVDAEAVSPAVLAELFDAAVRAFGGWGLRLWVDSLSADVRAHLLGLGFAPQKTTGPTPRHRKALLVKATDPRLAPDQWRLGSRPMLDSGSWDLRMMWSDGA